MKRNTKLSISAAFRLRNRLKARIKKLNEQVSRAGVMGKPDVPEDTLCFDGCTFTN